MPYTQDRYTAPYAPAMMVQPKQPYQTPSVLRPAPKQASSQREVLPSTLTFTDPTTLLTFMSSLASPSQLLTVTTLQIVLPSSTSLARQQVGQVAMGVHLMLRYTHNLEHLYLQWADAPSSVLTGTSFRLTTFSSTLFIDGTVISFLDAQSSIRKLDLGAWGAHLPPSSSSAPSSYGQYPPAPPMLSPTALPALAEFTGHAEVAAQLAAGGRPLQAVNLISGLPASTSSSTSTAEWREVMSGLAASPIGIRSLSVVGLERFGLEMLAEIGRHLHDLDYLFLRVQRPANSSVRLFPHIYLTRHHPSFLICNFPLFRIFSDGNTGRITSFPWLTSSKSMSSYSIRHHLQRHLDLSLLPCRALRIFNNGIIRARFWHLLRFRRRLPLKAERLNCARGNGRICAGSIALRVDKKTTTGFGRTAHRYSFPVHLHQHHPPPNYHHRFVYLRTRRC